MPSNLVTRVFKALKVSRVYRALAVKQELQCVQL
jgi:hypothetical protein